ncbi:DUF2637 domain-containing protein [Kitasatospora sp. NPDC056783]|uniref:DUF2637 domain-containing protein n=1 Tax=Kitasatospora sp. NPDC056783 TaxID=3345943 RepID=UPI0036BE8038
MTQGRPKVSRWDMAAIAALGATGFGLSYDALQQMAQAIHVRGNLSYAWPVVVDGFIAYGVRALVLLREAPWTARAYAWSLFAGATGTSVWANALHAIRLNEQTAGILGELHLGDLAVGSLSTIAPIALAGAVHLGIIVTRHETVQENLGDGPQTADPSPGTVLLSRDAISEREPSLDKQMVADREAPSLTTSRTSRAELTVGSQTEDRRSVDEKLAAYRRGVRWRARFAARILRRSQDGSEGPGGGPSARSGGPEGGGPSARPGGPDGGGPEGGGPSARSGGPEGGGPSARPGGPDSGGPDGGGPEGGGPSVRPGGPGNDLDPELLKAGRRAAAEAGRITRKVVGDGIRSQGLTVSNDRIPEILAALRTDKPPPPRR